jgi:hypothetical protein
MPLDTNLLYGEMLASAIAHAAIPFAAVLLIGTIPYMSASSKPLLFLGLCVLMSFVAQMAFLLVLQVSTCSGVKDFGTIAHGSLIAAIITGCMVAIPVFIESMRTMVSQLFMDHNLLLSPQLQKMQTIVVKAGVDVQNVEQTVPMKGGALVDSKEYEEQTLQEISAGSSYWGAFAGAYGVAFGSLIAATCPASA